MKTLLLLSLFVSWAFFSMGQIVLDQTDLPQVGDSQLDIVLDSSQTSTVSPGGSGANQVWDFTYLIDNWQQAEGEYVNPAFTPNTASFPTATVSSVHDLTNYVYYIADVNGLRILGYDIDNEITHWDQPLCNFPIVAYGNTMQHAARLKYNILSATTYDVLYIDLSSTADAWGAISTPAGTVNALRVYTTETDYDSSYVNGVGTQNSVTPGKYYYNWYAKGLGWPVLTISYKSIFGDPDYKEVRYASDLSTATRIDDDNEINEMLVFPNPASGEIVLNLSNSNASELTLNIYNVMGDKVLTESAAQNGQVVSLNGLCAGIYTVVITSPEWFEKQMLIVQ